MANDCEKITFYAPSDRRGGVKPIPSCEPGQLIVPEDLPVPPNPETPEPTIRLPRPLEVRSASYKFICDNKKDRKDYGYDPETNGHVKIPAKYLSPVDVDEPGYIENYYYGSGSAVIVPEGYVTTAIPFSSVPDIASDVLNYIAVNNREMDIEVLLSLVSPDIDDKRVSKLVRRYGFTAAQAEALVTLFDAAQRKADYSAYTYGESTLVCAWENTVQETRCADPTMAHYYDHPDAVYHAVIPAGTYKSLIGQADADRIAADAAAAMLNCFYVSDAVQMSCTDLGYKEPVLNTDGRIGTVVVPKGTFTSTISIEDATEQAKTYAKSLLICYYTNTKIELSCNDENARNLGVTPTPDNKVEINLTSASPRIPGKGQVITIEPGVIRSNISTEAAIQEATLLAESLLECCFVNVAKDVTCPNYEYTYTDSDGVKQTEQIPASKEKSPQYSMHIDAGVFSSCVSQEEADREAETFIQSTLSCYYCSTVVLPTCVPDDVLQKVKDSIANGDYSVLPLDPNNYDISQWSEDATVGAPPEYVCGFDYEQAQQIAETAARTIIHDLRSTEAGKCRYTNDLLYAGCYFNDPFGNDNNEQGTKAVYYKAYAPGIGKIPYFVYKANVDKRLNKNVSTPKLGTYVTIPAGTISITINDVPASFKTPDVIETTPFDQLDPDDDDNVTTEGLLMPGVEFNEKGEIKSEAMRVKAYANELALKMAMGMVQCLYANPEMSITCYDVGKPGASSPDGTNAWTVPAELFVGSNYKVVIREAKKLLESMVLCMYPNAPHTCSAGCNPCGTPLTNGFLSLEENDVTTLGMQSMTVHIPARMFWAATPAEANAQAMAMCALPAPTCERMISVDVTATCNAVCKAAGIDISLTEDDKEWGLMFWQGSCEGYIDGIFKDPCFEVIGAGSSSSDAEEVKVTVTSGISGSSCEDLLVSATALCVVECQAKAEYAFTNKQLFLECPDFASKYEIKQGTYRGNKETVREILRNLRRYYCSNIKLKQVGRKGIKVSDIEEDSETEGDNKTDTTHEKDINEETYAQIDGKQIIELNVKFEADATASVGRSDKNSNVFIYDNVDYMDDEDNALRKVQIAAVDSTYYAGTGIDIELINADDPCHPMYEISATGGGGEVTLEPVNPDPISLDGGTTLLDPLVISTDGGNYRTGHETFDAPPGTSFKLNVAAQVPKTPDCITVIKDDEATRTDVPRCEYFKYELSLGEISGLKTVDKDDSAGTGNGLAAKDLMVDTGWGLYLGLVDGGGALNVKAVEGGPIRVDQRGVGLSYDKKWFDVKDYALTFIGDIGDDTQISVTATTPESTAKLEGDTSVLAPLKISTTEDGTYSVDEEQTGTEFYLSTTRQEFDSSDCISIVRSEYKDEGPDRYERYNFSVVTGYGLKKVPNGEPLGYLGEADNVLQVKAENPIKVTSNGVGLKYENPIKVTSNGVGLNYDEQWFNVTNGQLTFIGDVGVKEASFGPGVARIVGTIGGAQWGEVGGEFSCVNGQLTVPLPAAAEYSSGTENDQPGLISGVEFSKTDTTSEIDTGMIKLAAANASSYCNSATDGTENGTPGGIYGIGYGNDNNFSIDKGYIRIPRPPAQGYFPDGLYNAATGEKITWQTFLAGTSPVPLSEPADGLRIMAFHLGKYLTFYLERV